MFDKDRGWIAFQGKGMKLPDQVRGKVLELNNDLVVVDCCLHKFPYDEVAADVNEKYYWMDGFVVNKPELIKENSSLNWQEAFIEETRRTDFPNRLRGGFSGLISDKNEVSLFNDHVGNHAVYYYCHNGILVCSTRVYYILELLKYNEIKLQYNVRAAHYMLEHGYMLDDSTFIIEIKRLLPGQKIRILKDGSKEITQYYSLDNSHVKKDMTEEDAVELIDRYFRQAVKREFDKDKEYGYEHLVDLSGGLDSRMVCWVAHDMGYIDQVNMTHCKDGYLDFEIAQKIAITLKHDFSYMPMNDFKWYRDAEELTRKNNGASLYLGITKGKRHFQILDKERFAINHTGMVGDAIVGSFFADASEGYKMPTGKEQSYSTKLHYDVDDKILHKYANKELYLLNVRGLLCAQTSYFTIQTYFEASSPFLDVDFLEAVLSVPLSMRCKHYIYFKWIEKKYPQAAEFGWEAWKGLTPKLQNMNKVKYWTKLWRKVNRLKMKVWKCEPQHIHPTDYWYEKDIETQQWAEQYFNDRIDLLKEYPDLMNDVKLLFTEGRTIEKTQAITVLAWAGFVYE